MFIHPKSIVRVLRMLMHLCAGHVTLLPGEFHPSKFLPQSDLGRRADSRWALPQISSWDYFIGSVCFFDVLWQTVVIVVIRLNISVTVFWISQFPMVLVGSRLWTWFRKNWKHLVLRKRETLLWTARLTSHNHVWITDDLSYTCVLF